MGYSTTFYGSISVEPPFTEQEIDFFNRWQETRRSQRTDFTGGKYYAVENPDDSGDPCGQHSSNIVNNNQPADGQPGLWCQWTIKTPDTIEWDGGEKFYNSAEWMSYIITHFFQESPIAKLLHPEEFDFLQGHQLNGTIFSKGDSSDDLWKIDVENNKTYISASSNLGAILNQLTVESIGEQNLEEGEENEEYSDAYYDAYENFENWDSLIWEEKQEIKTILTQEEQVTIDKLALEGTIPTNPTKNKKLKI